MPVSSLPSVLGTWPSAQYVLLIGSVPYTTSVPVGGDGMSSLSYSLSNENTIGSMSFTIEDSTNSIKSMLGQEVIFKTTSEVVIWGGVLTECEITLLPSGRGRSLSCTATAYDAWLDWKIIPVQASQTNVDDRVRKMSKDDEMVRLIIDKFCGPIIGNTAFVNNTNSNMPTIEILGKTVREALQTIADAATTKADETNRKFYVDVNKNLHYYKGTEAANKSEFEITNLIYTREILDTSGVISFWQLSDVASPAKDLIGGNDLTFVDNPSSAGSPSWQDRNVLINEPRYKSVDLKDEGYLQSTAAALRTWTNFTYEAWVNFPYAGGVTDTVFGGGLLSPYLKRDTNGAYIVGSRANGATYYWKTGNFASLNQNVHLVVRGNSSSVQVWVDGALTTNTFVGAPATALAGDTAFYVGSDGTVTDLNAAVGFVAVYNRQLSDYEIQRHYSIGNGINPQNFSVLLDANDGREKVYVAGKNVAGSGYVTSNSRSTYFGNRSSFINEAKTLREEIIERENSTTKDKKESYATAFLKNNADPKTSIRFESVGNYRQGGRRVFAPGMNIRAYIPDLDMWTGTGADTGLGMLFEITDVSVEAIMGTGVMRYTVTAGNTRKSGTKIINRRSR